MKSRSFKQIWSLFLVLALTLSLSCAALAADDDTGFSDVEADAWCADAVEYCVDNGLMNGTAATVFSPNATMTRGMLATVLYRAAGSPAVTSAAGFPDVPAASVYAHGIAWAAENGTINGYSDGRFGMNDPVSRQQIAAILWRYAGSPAASDTGSFVDQASIASYASDAVAWARENSIITGKAGNLFDPTASATRAQVAVMLYRYLTLDTNQPAGPEEPIEGNRILVAYFSATGNTEHIAGHLEAVLDADIYEIVPQEPYTAADLNYNSPGSRAEQEQNDSTARPAISGGVNNMEDYDVVFLGFPIWWGQAPKIIHTFLESYDFDGKTIVPFCTSASSGIGSSAASLHDLAPDANWLSGQRFSGGASQSAVQSWVDSLDLPATMAGGFEAAVPTTN